MKLANLQIEKFRSIEKVAISIEQLHAIVGENNSGKSAVLRALNSFFNFDDEKLNFENGVHQYTPLSNPKITLTFENVAKSQSLASKAKNNKLVVRLIFDPRQMKGKYEFKTQAGNWANLDQKTLRDIFKYIRFVLIPTTRDHSSFLFDNKSLLRTVIEEFLDKKTTAKRDTITSKLLKVTKYLEEKAFKKISDEITNHYNLAHNFSFEVGYKENINYSLLLNEIILKVSERNRTNNVTECGTGVQSVTVIALFRLLADFYKTNIIIGIEEPETNLHPQAQREFINSIKEKTEGNGNIQVLLTTHSPTVVDQLGHEQIALFRKTNDSRRGFKSSCFSIQKEFWEKNELDRDKYYKFHKYRNSEFLFAKLVIIAESEVDAEIIKYLLKSSEIDLEFHGVSIIDLRGIKNLKYPLYLIDELRIPRFVIIDKDFFLPYSNGELKHSRDQNGFPRYKNQFHQDSIIEKLIPTMGDRNKVLQLFRKNHSKALDILVRHHTICFKFNLEVDLINSSVCERNFYTVLRVPTNKREKSQLLKDRSGQIKELRNLLEVLQRTPHINLPNSYKRIKKVLKEKILNLN